MNDNSREATLLGRLILGHRRAARLTQDELARRASISVGALRDLEQGRTRQPRPGSLAALAHGLRLSPTQADELRRVGAGGLWLQVLGPVRGWRDGVPLPLGGPQQRAVLGLLATAEGSLVHRTALIDALWPDDPPASAVNLIQAHVSRLRGMLEPGRHGQDRDRLVIATGHSYRLLAGPGQLDLLAFRRLADAARSAGSAGDPQAACGLYRHALDLWQGEPLADVDLLRRDPTVAGLACERTGVIIDYSRTASADGGHDQVVMVLRDLVAREPLNEQAHARLMIALAGCGQQAEALAVYHDLCRRLDDELAIRPGPDLAQAHQLVLRQSVPSARTAAPVRVLACGAAPQRNTPRQLPSVVPGFTGRTAELQTLTRMVDEVGGDSPGTVVISAIGGAAGMGKTALALFWSHQVADRFADGQLYANLRGFDPSGTPAAPEEVVRGFLTALGVPPERIPPTADAQTALYRSLVAGKRILIVLDNARDERQVRPLLPASPASMVVVTSRKQLSGLAAADGARLLSLDVLAHDEAVRLLTARLGNGRVGAEPGAVEEIATLCACLPLALAVAAARAVARPRFPLTALANELRCCDGRLSALDAGDPAVSVTAVFSWSYQQLDPASARLFRLLSLHPGPDIGVPAAGSLAGIAPAEARRLLHDLARDCLITEHAPGRYAFHDLLRAYAASTSLECDSAPDRDCATARMLDHYLHTACQAAAQLTRHHRPLTLAQPQAGVQPEHVTSAEMAQGWLQTERPVLLALVSLAAETGFRIHAWELPWALGDFLDRRGDWHDWAATLRTALAAVTASGDLDGLARTCHRLGSACTRLGAYDDAARHLHDAMRFYRQIGDRVGQAHVHNTMGIMLDRQHRYGDALRHAQQALDLHREARYLPGQANALNSIGWLHAQLGSYQRALAYCQQAIGLHRDLGNRPAEAGTWDSLGYIHYQLGDHDDAITCYQQAICLFRELGNRHPQAETLIRLGDTHHASRRPKEARDAWHQALDILDYLHHPDARCVRAKLQDLATPQATLEVCG
jgi:DNA-binding SARP family transcriptional activator/tetratricopeptide (TPR) repeat protein